MTRKTFCAIINTDSFLADCSLTGLLAKLRMTSQTAGGVQSCHSGNFLEYLSLQWHSITGTLIKGCKMCRIPSVTYLCWSSSYSSSHTPNYRYNRQFNVFCILRNISFFIRDKIFNSSQGGRPLGKYYGFKCSVLVSSWVCEWVGLCTCVCFLCVF